MNRQGFVLIAVLCMAMVALAVAALPTGTSTTTDTTSAGNATVTPTTTASSAENQLQPFTGTPSAIPGTIQAEDYDTGGQNVAWFDTTPGNQGGAYRQDDVDIENSTTGNVVAFVKSSEWLTYSVNVAEAGEYQATFRASSPWTDREVWVWVDGALMAQARVPDTTSFETYENATATVTLPAGNHSIRLQFYRDAQNLDFVSFERTSEAGGGGSNVTPTMTGNVTPTPTSGQGSSGQGGGGNVTPGAGVPEATQYAADWPMPNRDYTNSRASTDSPITAANVASLNLTWAYNITGIGTYGGGASNPIILGDTIFFQDLKANVIALNRTTGAVKWMTDYNASFVEGPNGPTAGYGKIFVAKDAYTMAALNATSGTELWQQRLSFINTTGIDIAPAAYDNLVYTSTVPGTGDLFYAPGGIGYIYGLDQETGAIRWNVSTVDSPDLWGHPEVNSGGGCWYTPAIDTRTGMMFWAIANPAPFPGTAEWPSGSSRPGPNLYTNSMMAVDHTTGNMEWFTQVAPHDLFDHDLQIAPILASANVSGRSQEIVLGSGKMGKVYAFNRSTGALLWQTEVGNHNGNATLDVLPPGTTTTEPAVIGGVETPMAYADGVVYVPVINMITDWTPTSLDFSSFNISEGTGELVALDVNTGKKLWVNRLDSINVGSAMVVNDLVFTATFDGTIYAFNRTDGAQLWTYKAPSAINGWPAVAGNTIVWPAGGGGSFGNNATPQLLAFGLPGQGNQTGGGNQTTLTPTVTTTANITPSMVMTTAPTTATTTAATTAATTTAGGSTTVALTAQNIAFDKSSITVPAGATVTVNFNNMDAGVPHNVAVYTDASASTAIFKGQIVTGPTTTTYTFTAPSSPGTYFFRCDAHPSIMTGQFIVT